MILSDKKIMAAIGRKEIVIEPYRPECVGSNSVDIHLGSTLAVYTDVVAVSDNGRGGQYVEECYGILDCKKDNPTTEIIIPDDGFVLRPGFLYLGVTEEYTETHAAVPFIEGKSSIGRLGIDIHATAGKGDIGFCNQWTLEITCVHPVRVYAGMPIGQIIYFESGECDRPYSQKQSAKYTQRTGKPCGSKCI